MKPSAKAHKKIEDLLKEKKIYQIINDRVIKSPSTVSLREAVQLMQTYRSGYVILVGEDDMLEGIFTETDIVWRVLGRDTDWHKPISDFMTKDPIVMAPTDAVGAAIDLMASKKIYHMPLVDEYRRLIGMLSVRTLIRFLAEFYPTEVYNLPPDPSQVTTTQEGG